MKTMTPSTIVELAEVTGKPRVRMDLPTLHLGAKVTLRFHLTRQNGGRTEVLDVAGDFQVRAQSFEGTRQKLSVEALGVSPTWKAVKKAATPKKKLSPARTPPTAIQ